MAKWGWNFRSSDVYVTDPAGTESVTGADTYPTTKNIDGTDRVIGYLSINNVGANSPSTRNRSSSVDPRLSGLFFGGIARLVAQVPTSGLYRIELAMGDASFASSSPQQVSLYDGNYKVQQILDDASFSAGQWFDAAGVLRTSSTDWVNNNQSIDVFMVGTELELRLGSKLMSAGGQGTISHLSIEEITPSSPTIFRCNDKGLLHRGRTGEKIYLGGYGESITSVDIGGTTCTIDSQVVDEYVLVTVPIGAPLGDQVLTVSGATTSDTLPVKVLEHPDNITGSKVWLPDVANLNNPSPDWIPLIGRSDPIIKEDGNSELHLEINSGNTASRVYTELREIDGVDISGAPDFEILEELTRTGGVDDLRLMGRLNINTDFTATTYVFHGASIQSVVNNSFSSLASTTDTSSVNEKQLQRIRVVGDSIKVKGWKETDSEPAGWQLEITNSAVNAAGAIGHFFYSSDPLRVYKLAMAFNGETATFDSGPAIVTGDSSPTSENSTHSATGEVSDISNVNTFVMMGASITAGMVGTRQAAWQNYIENETGRVVTVVNEGVGGDTIADMDARLGPLLTTYAGDPNVMFCLHGIANDALVNAPWSGLTPTQQTDLYNEFEAFILRIVGNGNKVDLATSTFYDVSPTGSAVTDESLGSKPFNDNIIIPLAAIYNEPELFDSENGVPVSDFYTFTFNNYTVSQVSDGVHYTVAGYEALAHHRLSRMKRAMYQADTVPPITKLVDPTNNYTPTASRFVVDCSSTGTYRPAPYSLGITLASNTGVTSERIAPADPQMSPVTYTSDAASATLTGGITVAENKSLTIFNSELLASIQYTTTAAGAKNITIGNLPAGSAWTVKFACSSDLALSIATDITIGGNSFTAVAKDSGVLETQVVADGSGNIPITYSASSGFGYGALNGLEFINDSSIIVGSSDGQSESSTASGVGEREIVGVSVDESGSASHSSTGGREVTGSQDAVSGVSTSGGSGTRGITATASHGAQNASHTATSESFTTISGESTAAASNSTGSATGIREITAYSSASSQGGSTVGVAEVERVGVSNSNAGASVSEAQGFREVVGSASHSAGEATHSATSASFVTVSGESSLVSGPSTQNATGEREVVGESEGVSGASSTESQGSRGVSAVSSGQASRSNCAAIAEIIKTGQSASQASQSVSTVVANIAKNIIGQSDGFAQPATHSATSRPIFTGSLSKTSVSVSQDVYRVTLLKDQYSLEII